MHLQQGKKNNHTVDYFFYFYTCTHTLITAEHRLNFFWFEMWNSAKVPLPTADSPALN